MIEVHDEATQYGRAFADECPACGQYRSVDAADVRALDRAWRRYHAIRALVAFVVGVALGALVTLASGCGETAPTPPAPDAALPRCADVGCPDVAVCNSAGVCMCPQPAPAPSVECRR